MCWGYILCVSLNAGGEADIVLFEHNYCSESSFVTVFNDILRLIQLKKVNNLGRNTIECFAFIKIMSIFAYQSVVCQTITFGQSQWIVQKVIPKN